MKILSDKLDEVVGRQERTLSLLSTVQSTIAVSGAMNGNSGQPPNGNSSLLIGFMCLLVYYIYKYYLFSANTTNSFWYWKTGYRCAN